MRFSMLLAVFGLALLATSLPPQDDQKKKEEDARAKLPKEGEKVTTQLIITLNT